MLHIASILQRIETFAKTGLLVIKQDTQWVEFYCREGRLLCVGPIRTDATLGERLLQDEVISSHALQETMLTIGSAVPSETRIALTLMDLGYVKREDLRAWATKKTEEILRAVSFWSTGELHFEENSAPPSERLLVSLSISMLLASLPGTNTTSQSTQSPVAQSVVHECVATEDTSNTGPVMWDPSQSPTLNDPTQFFPEPSSLQPSFVSSTPYISADALLPAFNNTIHTGPVVPLLPPQTPPPMPSVSTTTLPPTLQMDTSFMRFDMVLVPADISTLQEQHLQVTQEQWRLLTRVDGHTSLQNICSVLNMSAEDVRRVAGELIAQRIVCVVPPSLVQTQEMSPTSQNLVQSGLSNGMTASGYAAATQSPWSNILPASDVIPQFSSTLETNSQWGNGGNGATFVHGQGWVAPVQPFQPLQQHGFGNSGMYASMGGNR
ncbi:MAG: hypothetical protein NVSMB49_07700 [Ktedonobacteraceae bacterium]